MPVNVFKYENINETVHSFEHSSGLKTFVIPKKGYLKKFATYSTHYGSINNHFKAPGDNEALKVPDGIAHFLEHKLFEQKDGSVMDKFAKLGSNPNAYTSFSQTVYLFSCTDRFEENFALLLDYVQNPYITEESVEKEKGIIGQEIMMYQDNADWRVFFNLLKAFYSQNPVSIDIAGTIESIGKINRDILYKCYNTFYHPSNMVILVVGDVEPEKVFEQIEKGVAASEPQGLIERIFPKEPEAVAKPLIEQSLAVSTPMFQIGFKDSGTLGLNGKDRLKREIGVKILLEMIMGKSSPLYDSLYSEGLINSSFECDYTLEENYAFSMFGGESPDPGKAKERVMAEIEKLGRTGLDAKDFERIRKAHAGRFIKQLNSVERVSHAFISVYFKGVNLFDYSEVYDKIAYEYAAGLFKEHFSPDNLAMSLIRPL